MLARIVHTRIDTREAYNGTAAWKTAHIADLSHKLRGSGFANTVHGAHSIVLWELHGKPCHLGPQCGQRHLARRKLLRRSGNEQLGVVILRQRGEMTAASSVEIQCFLADAADAVTVPEGHDKVYPFLVAVRTLRLENSSFTPGKVLSVREMRLFCSDTTVFM